MKLDFDTFLFFALSIGCMSLWYFGYVKPHDEARWEIIDCMDNDMSPESYEVCFETLKP